MAPGLTTKIGKRQFTWGKRTYVMGIINITPDSFSGDGLTNIALAANRAQLMAADGADILDIGGESTKPGYTEVEVDEELGRVIPAIQEIAAHTEVPISIDSYKYEVVQQALEAGASVINDQWGLKNEPRLAKLSVQYGVPIVLMCNQRDKGGFDPALRRDTGYAGDGFSEVIESLRQSIGTALSAGVKEENIIIDPGLGFGKSWKFDLELIRRLGELKTLNKPILVGPSRKSFIKMILNTPPLERLEGTAAAVAVSITQGADIVRVHDVKEITRLCHVTDAIVRGIQLS